MPSPFVPAMYGGEGPGPLTSGSTQECGQCTLPGLHSRAETGMRVNQVLRDQAPPVICHIELWMGEGCSFPLPLPLAVCGTWKSWPLIILAGEMSPPLTHCSTQERVAPAPSLGNTIELALKA